MKFRIITLFLCMIFSNLYGQIHFEKGYFISNNNEKTECLIKNNDWKNNPTTFEYSLAENSISQMNNIDSVKEFGIYGSCKYVRTTVKIDRSGKDVSKLSYEKNPVWSKETLFLKVLVEGKATLYLYENSNLTRFFYSVNPDTLVQQLIYKRYLVSLEQEEDKVATNETFKEQLWLYVRCGNMDTKNIETIKYRQNDLEKYFVSYNTCQNEDSVQAIQTYKVSAPRNLFNLKITPGIYAYSLSISNSANRSHIQFDNSFSYRIGFECEYILPFNKNKWGLLFEPTFQCFNTSHKYYNNTLTAKVDYKTLDFPIGVRYYLFLNDHTKIFFDGLLLSNYCFYFNSKVDIFYSSLNMSSPWSMAAGIGIDYKRISAEIRYYSQRELLADYSFYSSNFSRLSFTLGYRFLEKKK